MPIGFNDDVSSGKNLKVNDFILNSAQAMGLFNYWNAGKSLAELGREDLVASTQSDPSYYVKKVADYENAIAGLKKSENSENYDIELLSLKQHLDYHKSELNERRKQNEVKAIIGGAMYDCLPGGVAKGKLVGLVLKKPDEMAELFGPEYAGLDGKEISNEDKMKKYREIRERLCNVREKGQTKIYNKKLDFEQKRHNYDIQLNKSKIAKCNAMSTCIRDWKPEYNNPEDKNLQREVRIYLVKHKNFLLDILSSDRSQKPKKQSGNRRGAKWDNAEWLEKIKNNDDLNTDPALRQIDLEHEQNVEVLKNMSPADYTAYLRFDITTRMHMLSTLMEMKNKKTTLEVVGNNSALKKQNQQGKAM